MAGWNTNGLPLVTPGATYAQVGSLAELQADTEIANGVAPQSVAATAFQVAAISASVAANTATSTAAAATLNTLAGTITTEALTTAAGSTYSFVLTNSLIATTTTTLQVGIYSKSNTTKGMVPTSVTLASGSATIVFTNNGSAAINGTMLIAFHL